MKQPQQPNSSGAPDNTGADSTANDQAANSSLADQVQPLIDQVQPLVDQAKDKVQPLVDQAKQILSKESVTGLVDKLPPSVKQTGTKVATSFNKLTTTEKVLGGALVLLGVGLLARGGKSQNKQADTLHELLHFVNDRVEGYHKAAEESQDQQLRNYYQQLASQSQRFANELNNILVRIDGQRESSTTLKGKLYRRLMEATAAVTGHDEKAILATNIHGEQWAIAAYEEALEDHSLTGSIRSIINNQYKKSQKTYQELKRLESQQ